MSTQSIYRYEVRVHKRGGRGARARVRVRGAPRPGDVIRVQGRYWLIQEVEPGGDEAPARALASRLATGSAYVIRTAARSSAGSGGSGRTRRSSVTRSPPRRTASRSAGRSRTSVWRSTPTASRTSSSSQSVTSRRLDELRITSWSTRSRRGPRRAFLQPPRPRLPERPKRASPSSSFRSSRASCRTGRARSASSRLSCSTRSRTISIEHVRDRHRQRSARYLARQGQRAALSRISGAFERTSRGRTTRSRSGASGTAASSRPSGSEDDESDPDSGHGWMCRLLDSEALGAAGFERVRKAEIAPE